MLAALRIRTVAVRVNRHGGSEVFDRFSRSVALVKASWAVLRSDRGLLVYPLVSFVLTVLVTLTFAIPLAATGTLDRVTRQEYDPLLIAVGFAFYVVSYTVIIFCNSALVAAATIRLDGGDPTVGDGFRIAASRFPAIVGYAIISATVGMILRAISERGGVVGAIAATLVGVAWNVATFLAIPVLVLEGSGPITAVRRSAAMLRRTYGEQIVANVGIGIVFGLIAIGVALVFGTLAALLFTISPALGFGGIVLLVIVIAAVALVGAALSGIFTASLYRYAARGDAGPMFPPAAIHGAFSPKH
jgi:hypothetical protein